MSKYTECNMLQDYLFLSSLSRTTAEKGREIVRMNLLPPPTTDNNNSSHTNNNNVRMTNQQRQKEQLMKQIHYRKYKIMLLPDGMARRKLNQTNWNPKDRKMTFTVQLVFPSPASAAPKHDSKQKAAQDESNTLHKAEAEWCVHRLVLSEIEKRCFPNRKDLMRQRELLGVPLPPTKAVVRKYEPPTWVVSRKFVERQLGLTVPAQRDSPADADVVVLDGLPEHWQLLVPVYSSRLTNESTVKYLEWWNRKRKWEEANPDQFAAQEQPSTEQADASAPQEAKKQRVWGAQSQTPPAQPDPVPQQPMPPPPTPSIVSSSLLAMLSQRLGRSAPEASILAPESEALAGIQNDEAHATAVDEKKVKPAKAQAEHHPSTFIHIADADVTVHDLLAHAIPDGFSVVEFPVFEIRDSGKRRPGPGEILITYPTPIVPEATDGPSEVKEEPDSATVEPEIPSLPEQTPTSSLKPPPHGLFGFLGGYASDSDEDA